MKTIQDRIEELQKCLDKAIDGRSNPEKTFWWGSDDGDYPYSRYEEITGVPLDLHIGFLINGIEFWKRQIH